MSKSLVFYSFESGFPAGDRNLSPGQVVAAANDFSACDLDQVHRFGLARFKAHGCPGRNVEPFSVCLVAIESKSRIGFDEMVMAADLDRAVAEISDCHL